MLKFGIIALLLAAIAVPSVLFATQGLRPTGEARINAYKHENGRIEFALQVREGNGWGERILPTGRFLSANAPTGRWLSSTPVDIVPYIPIEGGHNWTALLEQLTEPGQLVYSANRELMSHASGRLSTTVRLLANEVQGPANPRVEFEIQCVAQEWGWGMHSHAKHAGLQASFNVYADGSVVSPAQIDIAADFHDPNYEVHPVESTHIAIKGIMADGTEKVWWVNQAHDLGWLLDEMADVETLGIALGGYRTGSDEVEVFGAWFYNWSAVFETSVQPNIEFCGLY